MTLDGFDGMLVMNYQMRVMQSGRRYCLHLLPYKPHILPSADILSFDDYLGTYTADYNGM